MRICHAIYLFLLCTITTVQSAEPYSLSDLDILAQEKNYEEFFKHALDIKPSKRSNRWKELVENLGIEFLDKLGKKQQIENSQFELVKKLSRWPIFAKNEFFNKKRDFLFLRHIQECHEKPQKICTKTTYYLALDFDHDVIFYYDLINTIAPYKSQYSQIWQLAKPLASHELSEFYCSKNNFKNIVLDRVFSHITLHNKLPTDIHKDCLKALTAEFKKSLVSTKNYQRDGAYHTLKNLNLLTKSDKARQYIINYLLDISKTSEIDQTISTFKSLSKNHQLRENLVNELLQIDPLPDQIFNTKKSSKAKVKTRILSRYLPEYLNQYAKTCISYLTGSVKFHNGNPTPRCHELFKLDNDLKVLPSIYKNEYSKATFFVRQK